MFWVGANSIILETGLKMYMKASEAIEIGRDLAPPIPPVSWALKDYFLTSRCTACFSQLQPNNPNYYPCTAHCKASVIYCSQQCRDSDILTHLHSGECHFLLAKNSFSFHKKTCDSQAPQSDNSDSCSLQYNTSTCDSRAALRLLFRHENFLLNSPRIGNLMTNHEHLLGTKDSRTAFTNFSGYGNNWDVGEYEDYELREVIQENAKLMHLARKHAKRGDGGDCCSVEKLGLCVVITNGVDVQVDEEVPTRVVGGMVGEIQCFVIGTAVYGTQFSWCNHSCRPNACYRFVFGRVEGLGLDPQISENGVLIEPGSEDYSGISPLQTETRQQKVYGPEAILRTIRRVSKGEEICITYTDLMQPKETRQMELWLKYGFVCHCERCDATVPSYMEQILQEVNALNMTCSSGQNNSSETETVKALLDEIKNRIDAFIFSGDSYICCEALESLLQKILSPKGFVTSESQLKSTDHVFQIHPLHHLCLDAYATLASAYRISANDAVHCMPNKHDLAGESIKDSSNYRATASYTLLLAGAVHHLFLSGEQGLIMTAGRFWLNAGEALARWILKCRFQTSVSEMNHHSIRNWVHPEFESLSKCLKCDCLLLNDNIDVMLAPLNSKSGFLNGKHHEDDTRDKQRYPMLLRASENFHRCMNKLVNLLWPSLKFGFSFLEAILNPLDYSWLTKSQRQQVLNTLVLLDKVERKTNENEDEHICIKRMYLFDEDGASLGGRMKHENFIAIQCALHCFSYSKYLLEICYSSNHPLINYMQNVLLQFSYGETSMWQ